MSLPREPRLDAAVLGQPAFGDIELREDFEPGDHRRLELARRRLGFVENAVDPVANLELVFEGLDVHVRGAAFEGAHQHLVDQPDHRDFGRHVAQVRDVFLVADPFDLMRLRLRRCPPEHSCAVQRFDARGDLLLPRQHRFHAQARRQFQGMKA